MSIPEEAEVGAVGGDPPSATKRSSRQHSFLWWLGFVVAVGLLMTAYHHLAVQAEGGSRPLAKPLISEMSAALVAGLLFWAVRWLALRLPLTRQSWRRRLPLYGTAVLVYSGVHTSLIWGLRSLLYPLAGLGTYDYGIMPLRYFMELPIDVLVFAIMVAVVHALAQVRAAREREVRTAQLESSLARSQLTNLRLQLQPHFLFNALNTISATMYDDPEAADEMLDRLAELLRTSLRTAQRDEVPLATELELLNAYLAILRARFGDRLEVVVAVEPTVSRALVPSLLLQPLVENAIRHGSAEREGHGRVQVTARRRRGELELTVDDDGTGVAAGKDPLNAGLGLTATAERLALLYGEAHRFTAGNLPAGGFRVRAVLPLRLRHGEKAA